ncbi:MAG: hypothetical protein ABIZ80_08805 [Bryobacteraceae bacterium]
MKVLLIILSAAALSSCNRASENKEAIRQGVVEYIGSRANVAAMDVEVNAIAFKGNEADASVTFRAKGAAPGSGMQMNYTLENKSGKWVVKNKAGAGGGHGAGATPGGGNPHGGGSSMMDDPGGPATGGAIPPGHPAVPGGGGKK